MRISLHPGLYDPDDPQPVLHGSRCESCGAVSFPAMRIGCEVCGAPESSLAPARLAAAGVIHSVATVHMYGGRDITAPFTIAEILLDDGPLVRATLMRVCEPEVIGRRAVAQWAVVRVDEAGGEVVEPRFEEVAP